MKENPKKVHIDDIPHATPEAKKGEYEVEVKYIVDHLPKDIREGIETGLYEYRIIEQGYLRPVGKDGKRTRMRVRKSSHSDPQKPDEYRLTDKSGIKGSDTARFEHEIPVKDQVTFEGIWALTDGHRVHKTRYYIPYSDPNLNEEFVIELDIFHGSLKGLVLAEVEFQVDGKQKLQEAEDKAKKFTKKPPKWFGRDVTGEKDWKNSRLASKGRPAD